MRQLYRAGQRDTCTVRSQPVINSTMANGNTYRGSNSTIASLFSIGQLLNERICSSMKIPCQKSFDLHPRISQKFMQVNVTFLKKDREHLLEQGLLLGLICYSFPLKISA